MILYRHLTFVLLFIYITI